MDNLFLHIFQVNLYKGLKRDHYQKRVKRAAQMAQFLEKLQSQNFKARFSTL